MPDRILASVDTPVREAGLPDGFPSLGVANLADVPVSVFSGFGLAMVFTLNAVFSQPIAGFDYLPSRLDAESRTRSDSKAGHEKPATRS